MENLLTNQFLTHHVLEGSVAVVPFKETEANYFELLDDNTMIYFLAGEGVAPYSNNSELKVKVINYESFHITLPPAFILGRQICDLITYTSTVNNYFSLNELTDTDPKYVVDFTNTRGNRKGKRNKAMEQLHDTLALLISVPAIRLYIDNFTVKKCCFFNKKATPPVTAPAVITAVATFNTINTLTEEGFEMSHPGIEACGFKLFEYSGGKSARII